MSGENGKEEGAEEGSLDSLNRRSLIRAFGATGGFVAGSAAIDTAMAKEREFDEEFVENAQNALERRRSLEREYEDHQRVKQAVRDHGHKLLEELTARGYLRNQSLNELSLDTQLDRTFLPPESDSSGVAITFMMPDFEPTALIMASEDTDDYNMGLYIQPEAGKSYSIINEKTSSEPAHVVDTGENSAHSRNISSSANINGTGACWEEVGCDEDDVCHIDPSEYCTHVWYEKKVYHCCSEIGCTVVGTKPCDTTESNQCHNQEGWTC